MYTVYDFINNDIESKHMKFGWKLEINQTINFRYSNKIVLTYSMLNFDYNSLKFLGEDAFNMFLNSSSYLRMREKKEHAMKKYKRLYYNASSIDDLKIMLEANGLKIDIDHLIRKTIDKKSKKIKDKLKIIS